MLQVFGEQKTQIADESPKTRKAREKLKRQMEALDKKMTPQALKKKSIEIYRWIERHAQHRVILKSKSICLFDENQNTADLSQRVIQLTEKLKKEFHGSKEHLDSQFYMKHKRTVQE